MTVTARDLAMLLETIKKHNYPFNPNQHLKVSPRIEIESAAPNPNSEPVIEPK
jgi:hypothetical protein